MRARGLLHKSTASSHGFPWERRAPARLQKPRWSVALPGESTGAGLTEWTASDIQRWRDGLLALLLLVVIAGCAVERGTVYVKDGKQYGVTASGIWRERWWNYYERGSSYAEGEFWDSAITDFQAAITQRQDDQRRARTYGCTSSTTFHTANWASYTTVWRVMQTPSANSKPRLSMLTMPRPSSTSTRRASPSYNSAAVTRRHRASDSTPRPMS